MESSDKTTLSGSLPHHPHDMLFKAVFKYPARALEVLKAKVPKELMAILNLSTLRLDDSSYVDENLAEQMADVCLLCDNNDGEPVLFSFIIEHKSYLPQFPPLQIMNYELRVWNRQVQAKPARPMPVVPVVFYHGKEKWIIKPWGEYLKGWRNEFVPYTPNGSYIFIDLSAMPDEEIRQFRSGFLVTALLLMKHRFERQFLLDNLYEIVSFVESDTKEDEDRRIEYLKYVLRYLQGLEAIKWEEAKEKLNPLKMTSQVMDVYEDIKIEAFQEGEAKGIEKGIEKGMEKGREEEKFFAAFKMLRQRFEMETISDLLDVPLPFLTALQKHFAKELQIVALLKKGNENMEDIAKQAKVPLLFVRAIKLDMEKHKK